MHHHHQIQIASGWLLGGWLSAVHGHLNKKECLLVLLLLPGHEKGIKKNQNTTQRTEPNQTQS